MLARKSKIFHPGGEIFETPILVPSFSSKGLRFKKRNNKKSEKGKKAILKSEAEYILKATSEFLNDTILLSAYDLYYDYIPYPPGRGIDYFPQLSIIDSGGYETIEGFDYSETFKYPIDPKDWSLDKYHTVLKTWNFTRFPAAIVSYDNGQERRKNLNLQIKQAETLFNKYPKYLGIFLIKSSKKNQLLDVENIIKHISLLDKFKVVGFTEKELGSSIHERMINVAKLRKALDNVSINSPIHIFGSLDPITCILYYLAGAEIFDGLTWIKFSYHEGLALYLQNFKFIEELLHEKDNTSRDLILTKNIIYLRNLQSKMKTFIDNDFDFQVFNFYSDTFKDISKTLKKV